MISVTPRDVAARVVILKAVVVHALASPPRDFLESSMAERSWIDRQKVRWTSAKQRDEHWRPIKQAGLVDSMSAQERAFARSTAVTMTARQQIDACWRIEALQVMLWALHLVDQIPPYDRQADEKLLQGFPPASIRDFLASESLRPSTEIESARDTAKFWHWRSRTRQLQVDAATPVLPEELQEPDLRTYDDIVRKAVRWAAEKGSPLPTLDEDLAVFGRPYAEMDPDQWDMVRSITMERHFALNWLCGYAPYNDWDQTPTDT